MTTRGLLGPFSASLSALALVVALPGPTAGAATTTTTAPTTTTTSSTTTTTLPATGATTTSTTVTSTTTPTSPTTALPGAQAQRLLASAIGAANSQRGFTWRATLAAGHQSETAVGQSGLAYGSQTITGGGPGGLVKLSAIVAGARLFVNGNPSGLEDVLSLKASVAKAEAGKWIVLPPKTGTVYQALRAGLTVPTATSAFDMVGVLKLLPARRVAGHSAVGVSGSRTQLGLNVAETLYVRGAGRPFPVELVTSASGLTETLVFGNWGRRAQVTVPHAVVLWQKSWAS